MTEKNKNSGDQKPLKKTGRIRKARRVGNKYNNTMTEQKPVQSKTTMILISFFLGGLGIHRLMMGYSNWWLMLITFGGCGIWTLIDFIKIITGSMKMADGRDLV